MSMHRRGNTRSWIRKAEAALLTVALGAIIGVTDLRAQAGQAGERVPVLIGFQHTPGATEQAVVRAFGGTIKYSYTIVPAIAASVPRAALNGLRNHPLITVVENDGTFHEYDAADYSKVWGVRKIRADQVHVTQTGVGVKVAVIDSGVDCIHAELNCISGSDFVDGDNSPQDEDGHGTHVAGTIAAMIADGSGVAGVAPSVQIVPLRVLDQNGSGSFSDVIGALQWINDYNNDSTNGDPIKVTNNSYGSSRDPGSLVHNAFDSIAGSVLHVAASGNATGFGACRKVGYPAAYGSVMAVGATDETDTIASFSCSGAQVELSAPGVSIFSTMPGTSCTLCTQSYGYTTDSSGRTYGTLSGTSMASPHVAGTAALVFGALANATVNEVRTQLQNTAVDLGATGWDKFYGYGRVDADSAVSPGNQPPTAAFTYTCTGLSCSFDAKNSSDPDGYIASYGWDFGDTSSASGETLSHTYTNAGTYNVTLTVTDDGGATGTYTQVVTAGTSASTSVHVGQLEDSSSSQRNRWTAAVSITVDDDSNKPVGGATVTGTWSAGASGSSSCTTNSTGTCSVSKNINGKKAISATFTVADITGTNLSYDPGNNVVTTITVNKP